MQQPIGLFDSGLGGTSIWKEIVKLLPYENTVYLADSKNAPYGEKTTDEIIYFSEKNTEFLLNYDVKLIVVACNTATTNAIKHLRKRYKISFVGIEPAIKPAALSTKTKAIGILATQGTLSSQLFDETKGRFTKDIRVIEQIGFGLVELIEKGQLKSDKLESLLQSYLQPMLSQNIDYLILGCTHYPYLIPQIKCLIPSDVNIIDSGEAVARQVKSLLEQNMLLNQNKGRSQHRMFSTGDTEVMQQLLSDRENIVFNTKKVKL